jgi:small conductance mechanosensitive channel
VVQTLNTRATVLVTLDGNHIRIPNNIIYKEIMVNSSATPSSRSTFDVVIPYEVSTASALEAVNTALRGQEGLSPEPAPRALVEALEPGGVRLRAYFWMPAQGVDGFKLLSDVKLRTKVALQQAGIAPPPSAVTLTVAGSVPVLVAEHDGESRVEMVTRPGAVLTVEQAEANLRRDASAAERVATAPQNGHHEAVQRVLNESETRVSEEGENLIADPKPTEDA